MQGCEKQRKPVVGKSCKTATGHTVILNILIIMNYILAKAASKLNLKTLIQLHNINTKYCN